MACYAKMPNGMHHKVCKKQGLCDQTECGLLIRSKPFNAKNAPEDLCTLCEGGVSEGLKKRIEQQNKSIPSWMK